MSVSCTFPIKLSTTYACPMYYPPCLFLSNNELSLSLSLSLSVSLSLSLSKEDPSSSGHIGQVLAC